MSLITASHNPAPQATVDDSVLDACKTMLDRNVGAVAVTDKKSGKLVGIFTERDVLRKVVTQRLDPKKTELRKVMTSPCLAIPADRSIDDAVALMVQQKVNHLALVGPQQELLGIVSYRTLLNRKIDYLNVEVDHMAAYMGYDGGGD